MDRPSSKAAVRRPKPVTSNSAASTNTQLRVPQPKIQTTYIDGAGEPLVEDFQTRHDMANFYGPSSPGLNSLPGIDHDHLYPTSPSFPIDDIDDFDDDEDDLAAPPPNLNRRSVHSMHEPSRRRYAISLVHMRRRLLTLNSSNANISHKSNAAHGSPGTMSSVPTTPDYRDRSSVESAFSEASAATSVATLPPLQTKGPPDDLDRLEPVLEDDPANWDLLAAPAEQANGVYQMETRSEQLFSQEHLRLIFADPRLLLKFTGFLNSHRPQSIRLLIYYLDALKALRAIDYANAIADGLEPLKSHDFTERPAKSTVNASLKQMADNAFEVLARDDLPAYIAYTWIQVVSVSIQRRVTGTLAPHLREASEGLAEVFCLSDPSRQDNPIVFASEGINYLYASIRSHADSLQNLLAQRSTACPTLLAAIVDSCKVHAQIQIRYDDSRKHAKLVVSIVKCLSISKSSIDPHTPIPSSHNGFQQPQRLTYNVQPTRRITIPESAHDCPAT